MTSLKANTTTSFNSPIKAVTLRGAPSTSITEGTDDWTVPSSVKNDPYFIEVKPSPTGSNEATSLVEALRILDNNMRSKKDYHLITRKGRRSYGGTRIEAGNLGILEYAGRPIVALGPGRYWNFSPSHRWVDKSVDMTNVIQQLGLTAAQVGQSQAVVVLDPQNRVFVIRNGGFAAYGAQGWYRVQAVVDTLDLGENTWITDNDQPNGKRLGQKLDVSATITINGQASQSVVATFFNIPANNVVIVQQGNEPIMLMAGQHVITNPHTTFRDFYSTSETQMTFDAQGAYTNEGLPVILRVNLRYRLEDPLKLTKHYDTVAQALTNPVQQAINKVVARQSYQQFMRTAKLDNEGARDLHAKPFLETFKAEALLELSDQATEYGIIVEDVNVVSRELAGDQGRQLNAQADLVIKNQGAISQIQQNIEIATGEKQKELRQAELNKQINTTQADTNFYTATKAADAKAYATTKEAEAEAAKLAIETEQKVKTIEQLAIAEANRIEMIAKAWTQIPAGLPSNMLLQQLEVEKLKALPSNTVFLGNGLSPGVAGEVLSGFASATGASIALRGASK